MLVVKIGNKNNIIAQSFVSHQFTRFSLHMFLIEACCFAFCKLNSLPIDELGEGAYESGWWCHAKYKP